MTFLIPRQRVVTPRIVLDRDHDTPWKQSPGRIPRQDVDASGDTFRTDRSQRWADPTPAVTVTAGHSGATLDVRINWGPIFVWSNINSGRYMNHRLWYRIDKGAKNLGGREDMIQATSLRIDPGFDPSVTSRHKNASPHGYVFDAPFVELDPWQQATVWVAQSIEIDKDSPKWDSAPWYPTVRHFESCTVTTELLSP